MPPTTRDPAVYSGGASSLAALPPSSAGSLEGLKSGVDSLLLQLEEEKHQSVPFPLLAVVRDECCWLARF